MNREFLEKLDYARSISNVPFIINSGFRTSSHNKKVGGKEKIVDEFEKSGKGLLVIDGKLIEKPVLREMQRKLSISKRLK